MNEKTFRETVLAMDDKQMREALLNIALDLDEGKIPSVFDLAKAFKRLGE